MQEVRSVQTSLEKLKQGKRWNLQQRLRWLKELDSLIKLCRDSILKTVAHEKGTGEHEVLLNEYAVIRMLIKEYRKTAKKTLNDEIRNRRFSLNWANKRDVVKKEPLGIVGIISPFNYPFSLAMGPIISALLAGNGALLKPPEETPNTNSLVKHLVKLSLRCSCLGAENIFEVLPTDIETGKELVNCSSVDKIHFTGSAKTGWAVHQANAKTRFTPVTLELGGSNAAIVLEDANLKTAARVIIWARFVSMGCNNIKRVFVVESVYDQFRSELENQFKALKNFEIGPCPEKESGNYRKFRTNLGLYSKSHEYLCRLTGNDLYPLLLFITSPSNKLSVLTEETFVPILPIVKVQNAEKAVEWANKSKFGLGASIFTKNKRIFKELAGRLECGGVYHNDAMTEFAQPQVPFGGWKESGHGYSHGPEGLLEFVRLKTVIEERWKSPKLQLFPWTPFKIRWLKRLINWIIKFS